MRWLWRLIEDVFELAVALDGAIEGCGWALGLDGLVDAKHVWCRARNRARLVLSRWTMLVARDSERRESSLIHLLHNCVMLLSAPLSSSNRLEVHRIIIVSLVLLYCRLLSVWVEWLFACHCLADLMLTLRPFSTDLVWMMSVQNWADNRQLQRQITHIVRTLIVKLPFSQTLTWFLDRYWCSCADGHGDKFCQLFYTLTWQEMRIMQVFAGSWCRMPYCKSRYLTHLLDSLPLTHVLPIVCTN